MNLQLTPELIGRAIDKTTLNKALIFIIAVAAAGFFFDPSTSLSFLTRCR